MVNKGYKNKQIIEEDQSKSSNKKRTMNRHETNNKIEVATSVKGKKKREKRAAGRRSIVSQLVFVVVTSPLQQ